MRKRIFKIIKLLNLLLIFSFILYLINLKYASKKVYSTSYNINNSYNKIYENKICIPKININQRVIKATPNYSNLDNNLVYYKHFNVEDKIIIFGHSGIGYGTYFNRLDELVLNDVLYLYNENKKYTYKVNKIYKIDEKKVDILNEEINSYKLLLITCDKKNNKKRLVIELELRND